MLVDLSNYTVRVTGTAPSLMATVAELPGCVAVGATMAELDTALQQAIVIYLDEHAPDPKHRRGRSGS